MANSTIVHGPQGCGKTRDGAAIARALGLKDVVELDELSNYARKQALQRDNVLFLTHDSVKAAKWANQYDCVLMAYSVAKAKVAQS